jgi:hypothetical protein
MEAKIAKSPTSRPKRTSSYWRNRTDVYSNNISCPSTAHGVDTSAADTEADKTHQDATRKIKPVIGASEEKK